MVADPRSAQVELNDTLRHRIYWRRPNARLTSRDKSSTEYGF